jgi:hypothetical protein
LWFMLSKPVSHLFVAKVVVPVLHIRMQLLMTCPAKRAQVT